MNKWAFPKSWFAFFNGPSLINLPYHLLTTITYSLLSLNICRVNYKLFTREMCSAKAWYKGKTSLIYVLRDTSLWETDVPIVATNRLIIYVAEQDVFNIFFIFSSEIFSGFYLFCVEIVWESISQISFSFAFILIKWVTRIGTVLSPCL